MKRKLKSTQKSQLEGTQYGIFEYAKVGVRAQVSSIKFFRMMDLPGSNDGLA
jgi:hypothetical protein